MKIVVVGLGVQGRKRVAVAGDHVVATVDPQVAGANFRRIEEVPLSAYEAACVCVPDQAKPEILTYLIRHGKHVLVEKPLAGSKAELAELIRLAKCNRVAAYTAYNHRFEPHLVRLHGILQDQTFGQIYMARFFYGNGTARDVRNSPWRDQGLGVLPDLGSHLLDLTLFLFGNESRRPELWSLNRFENKAPDHALFGFSGRPLLEMETSLLSWRNSFHLDVFGELGSAHMDSLCKWGPSRLTVRKRVFPSGRPEETVNVVEQSDPTWRAEYDYFIELCRTAGSNWENDLWIGNMLEHLKQAAHGAQETLG